MNYYFFELLTQLKNYYYFYYYNNNKKATNLTTRTTTINEQDLDMRIVAGTAGMPAEPSSHKVRNQNRLILCVVVAKLNQ